MLSESVEPMQYASDFYTVFKVLMCFLEPLYIAFTDKCEMLIHAELFLFSFFSDRSPTKVSYFSEHHSFVSQAFLKSFRDLHCL